MTQSTKPPSLTIDYARYERYLEDSDLTEAQKKEFLDTLWNIIVSFVDLGFGVHPLQQVGDAAESPEQLLASAVKNMVEPTGTPSHQEEHNNKEKRRNT